ncbi:hypothetical protein [Prauserella muralis]|uniref:Uncharacterized protein n=1 Tax=Prauserella muralis TaxID=588067 RepID=A0A2V4AKR2_9PSEU|nr:hypothetical protein [Prauserella muralis]PXY20867.1 hypothetical protein BAY60_25525 [Prauserella muralis]TWE29907.1 hypothetical protein FHX69_2600 [Prauserella muralis]
MSNLDDAFDRALDLAEHLEVGSTDAEKRLAEALVDVRQAIRTDDGTPDWLGLTHEYRWRAQTIYSAVPAGAGEMTRLKSRLRQHNLRIVRERTRESELTEALARAENAPIPLDGEFYDNIAVYVRENGRKCVNGNEAQVLILVAGRLLALLDPDAVAGPERSTVAMALEQVVAEPARQLATRMSE